LLVPSRAPAELPPLLGLSLLMPTRAEPPTLAGAFSFFFLLWPPARLPPTETARAKSLALAPATSPTDAPPTALALPFPFPS